MTRTTSVLLITLAFLTALLGGVRAPQVSAQAALAPVSGPPTVNGLFYGDNDYLRYTLFDKSENGSELYIYVDSQAGQDTYLYAALVVSRTVNDNVFDMFKSVGSSGGNASAYEASADWKPDHNFDKLVKSDMAQFTLICNNQTYKWEQDLLELDRNADPELARNMGRYYSAPNHGHWPVGIESASSTAWNVNNYRAKYGYTSASAAAAGAPWDMYVEGTAPEAWHSPYTGALGDSWFPQPDYGYPAAPAPIGWSAHFEWEWPLVYEWRVNLSTICSSGSIELLVGSAHNSPSKIKDENDRFLNTQPTIVVAGEDWGDLPASYGTLAVDNGPRHRIYWNGQGIYLGRLIDGEFDGQPSLTASGDDDSNLADEDGVQLLNVNSWNEVTGGAIEVTFTNGENSGLTDGWLAVWFDWNYDGKFDASEAAVYQAVALPTGTLTQTFTFDIPSGGLYHPLYYRARLFTSEPTDLGGRSAFLGWADNGEVEDYWYTGPTAVTLRSFTARGLSGSVQLQWETESESDTLGYNLYRALSPDGSRTKLNDGLIPSQVAPGSLEGAIYQYRDARLRDRVQYYYFLEHVGLDSSVTTYEPIAARTK